MIQFKGAYFNKKTKESKSVLVQFDGVLLHIWQIADPFCRILASDVFTLKPAFGKGKRCIKLPNGCKIETDDIDAFTTLYATRSPLKIGRLHITPQWRFIWMACAGATMAGMLFLFHRMVF